MYDTLIAYHTLELKRIQITMPHYQRFWKIFL